MPEVGFHCCRSSLAGQHAHDSNPPELSPCSSPTFLPTEVGALPGSRRNTRPCFLTNFAPQSWLVMNFNGRSLDGDTVVASEFAPTFLIAWADRDYGLEGSRARAAVS